MKFCFGFSGIIFFELHVFTLIPCFVGDASNLNADLDKPYDAILKRSVQINHVFKQDTRNIYLLIT